jgi:hypothetical protein
MSDDAHEQEPMPPRDEVARQLVAWLEDRGATLTFRHGLTEDWHFNLDGVADMTKDEAGSIAAAAFEIRDEIRTVLLLRRAVPTVH